MKVRALQLPLQTFILISGFMLWVVLSALMPFIKEDIVLTSNQQTLVTAIPVILGSILRVPIGYFTNRYGARNITLISFLLLLFPVYLISIADSFADLLIGGLFIGMSGAIFSAGVTSVPKYFPKERHGFVNGIYGMGNIGTAITTFAAPVLAQKFGWQTTVQMYLILIAVVLFAAFFFGDRKEPRVMTSLKAQIKSVYKNEKMWFLSLFYFLTFGAFVAFTVYLPNFLVSYYELSKVDAGIRTAGFIGIATFLRPVGGWLGDRFNSFKILMFVFSGITVSGIILAFNPSLFGYTIGCLSIAVCAGLGNGTIFKLVPLYFTKEAGIVNGIVSALGGLGGFFPPLVLSFLFEVTGHYAIGYMAMSQVASISLMIVIGLFYQEKLNATQLELTNIRKVNNGTDRKTAGA